MQRAVGTVLVVVLVVSAGCSAVFDGGGGGEPASTVTPMAVPTDEPAPTPVPQLAPGLTGQGIENASALVMAHASQLRNASFTTRTNTTRLAANGSVVFRRTGMNRAGPPGEGVYSVSELNGSSPHLRSEAAPVHTEVWSNDDRLLLNRRYANGTTTYRRINGTTTRYGTGAGFRFMLEPLGTANTSVTELERNGTTLYRVRGRIEDAKRRNVSVQLVVDPRGVIRKYRTVQRTTFEGNVFRTVSKRRFSKVGATAAPERPSWIEEAINRTAPAPQLAPGLTEEGIENANALTDAHTSFLSNRSFVRRSNDTSLAPNGSVLARSMRTLRLGAPGEGFSLTIEENGTDGYLRPEGSPVYTALWSNGEQVFTKRRYANGRTVQQRLTSDPEAFRERFAERNLYLLGSFRPANTTVTKRVARNGTTLYRIEGSASNEEWRTIDLQLLVSPRGVVHEVGMVQRSSATNDAPKIVTNTRFYGFNTTTAPERPSWVEDAMNRTTTVPDRTTVTRKATTTIQPEMTTGRNATTAVDTAARR